MDTINTFQRFVGQAATNLGVTFWFRNSDTEVVDWEENENPPSDVALNAEIDRLKAEYDAQEYARNRATEYPSPGDQMDMIYKDNKNSTTTHADAVEAVKTKWPKDNSGPVE